MLRRRGERSAAAELLLRSLDLRLKAGTAQRTGRTGGQAPQSYSEDNPRQQEALLLAALTEGSCTPQGPGTSLVWNLPRRDGCCLSRLEQRLGGGALARAQADTRLLGWDDATAIARRILPPRSKIVPPRRRSPVPRPSPSASWKCCACWSGGSDEEIAASLVLSVRTVERHIENLYVRTGVHGRAAITEFALRHALLSWVMPQIAGVS